MKGKVFIVGAGPGDPGLITVRGFQALARADVVLYDRLAGEDLLAKAPAEARCVFVGKEPGRHAVSQDEINRLLADYAREGLIVVRLKGGDPFIFGRGCEEAEFLTRQGIDFEVVPGVTAASAASAFTGIPLTDRRFASSVIFATGREGDSTSPGVNWEVMAASGATLVLYMARAVLGELAERLIRAGLDGATPAAVVERASQPAQRSVTGVISDIAAKSDEAGIEAPCIVIIGSVVTLGPRLSWFERLPLFGRSILITRSEGSQDALAGAFESLGARVIRFPTIEIAPAPAEKLTEGLSGFAGCDWIVFTSAVGVEIFFDTLRKVGSDLRVLSGMRIAVVGPATHAAIGGRGLVADLMPEKFTGRDLLAALVDASQPGDKFLLWRAAGARRELAEGLSAVGREVIEVAAYESVLPSRVDSAAVERLRREPPAAILFSSASTASNFVAILGEAAAKELADRAKVVSIGPVTSQRLRDVGLGVHSEAGEHTGWGLFEATLAALGVEGPPPWVERF